MKRDSAYLVDIAHACELVTRFIEGLDEAAFRKDAKTQSAVIHQLLIIGEAVKRLSDSFTSAHPEVPWSDAARMRDLMIHHYESVNLHLVWQAASRDTPALRNFMQTILSRPDDPPARIP